MYDYVIVGAGSAGCVLAARLSEDPQVKVCLVEAGPPDTAQNIHVPAAFAKLFRTHLDWDYDTHDEPFLDRRRIYLPRGRVLGGTSSMNTQIYIRGNRLDYDEWGQPGWSFDELLPYFLRSEDNERGASPLHGTGGPIRVSEGRAKNPMSAAFVEAAVQAGYPLNEDFNGERQDGFGYFQLTQRDGKRASSSTAFLHPAMGRANLAVETDLQVHRVLIEHGRAVGVVGTQFNQPITIRAEREVILCGGTYNSPQLLMLSGIGPAQMLSMLGIPVVVDQPEVGQNMQDHVIIPLVYPHSYPISMLAAGAPENVEEFMNHGRGPLTSNGPEAGGFLRTRPDLPAPDIEMLMAPVMYVDNGLGIPTDHALSYGPSVIKPASRGVLTLASDDPTTKPRIQHNYFAEKADLDAGIVGLRIALEIADSPALKKYTGNPFRPPVSRSDSDLADYIRRYTHSVYHPTSTCAMGRVVDAELRVFGVEGLRVADCSVMPSVIRGNTHAPAVAIGEKAADLVRGAAPAGDAATRKMHAEIV